MGEMTEGGGLRGLLTIAASQSIILLFAFKYLFFSFIIFMHT